MAVVNSVALGHLRVLGAGAWAHIPEEKEGRLTKLEEVLVGYSYWIRGQEPVLSTIYDM